MERDLVERRSVVRLRGGKYGIKMALVSKREKASALFLEEIAPFFPDGCGTTLLQYIRTGDFQDIQDRSISIKWLGSLTGLPEQSDFKLSGAVRNID